ncbi:MAG: TonB-dependent receptor, partial [Halioglobus sp.]|nr:TonB-dependent receptor [Halioglobus sp.]
EVLRGPQGTLYGRNSIGGAVNFISKRPTAEWSGRLTGELANYDGYLGQAYVSGPLTDKLGFLAGVSKSERDGFQENTFNGRDYEEDDSFYGTVGFEHKTTDNWTTNLKVIGIDRGFNPSNGGYILEPFKRDLIQQLQDVDTGAFLNFPGMFPGQNFVNMRQGLAVSNPALRDRDEIRQDRDTQLDTERVAAFLTSEYAADAYTLKYTAGFSKYWYETSVDADASVAADSGVDWSKLLFLGVPVSQLTGFTITPSDMTYEVNQEAQFTSHELQFASDWDSRFALLSGLYYYHSDEEQVVSFREFGDDLMEVYAFFGRQTGRPVSDNNFLYRGEANVDSRSYAAYSQLSWNWTEATVLTAGLRYSYDEKKGNDNTFVQFVGNPDDPVVFRAQDDSWDEITWRLGVDHFLNDNHFLYGFIATGYRSGGFNFQKPTASTEVDVVEPESLLSYEIGYKGTLWENRANLAVSAYYYDYEDLQVIKQDVVEGIGLNTFVNADKANAWGLEVEGRLLATDDLLLSATYSWNDSEYKAFLTKDANACALGPLEEGRSLDPLCTDELDLAGNQFPTMPEHKVSANVTYSWSLLELDWSATVSYFYTHDAWATAFNNPEFDRLDNYDSWDLRLTAATEDATWRATAFVRNLEDDRQVVERGRPSTVTQNAQSTLSAPRQFGISLDYNF